MHDACKVYVCAHGFIHRKIFRDYQVSHKNWTLFWMIGSKINITPEYVIITIQETQSMMFIYVT